MRCYQPTGDKVGLPAFGGQQSRSKNMFDVLLLRIKLVDAEWIFNYRKSRGPAHDSLPPLPLVSDSSILLHVQGRSYASDLLSEAPL